PCSAFSLAQKPLGNLPRKPELAAQHVALPQTVINGESLGGVLDRRSKFPGANEGGLRFIDAETSGPHKRLAKTQNVFVCVCIGSQYLDKFQQSVCKCLGLLSAVSPRMFVQRQTSTRNQGVNTPNKGAHAVSRIVRNAALATLTARASLKI